MKVFIDKTYDEYKIGDVVVVERNVYGRTEIVNYIIKRMSSTILHRHPFIDIITTDYDANMIQLRPERIRIFFVTEDNSKLYWIVIK